MPVGVLSMGGASVREVIRGGIGWYTITGVASAWLMNWVRIESNKRLEEGACKATVFDLRGAVIVFDPATLPEPRVSRQESIECRPRATLVSPVVYARAQQWASAQRDGRLRAIFMEPESARAWIDGRLVRHPCRAD